MSKYNYFDNIFIEPYDFKDKQKSVNNYIKYMLARTQSMFKYNNLPSTIPQKMLELYLQCNGACAIASVNSNLYAFVGGFGGEPDEYYRPTIYTVANPYLKFNKNLKIDDDCIIIPNDSLFIGLLPMFNKYATQLVENDLSMNIADINSRIISLISASDDRTRLSAEQYIKDIIEGKLGIIADNSLINDESIKAQVFGTSSASGTLTNLIEYQQYIKASWFNDLGLNANYNMKRESINSNEAQLNDDMLLPLIDDMLKNRQDALDKVNNMFGTDISVELNSAWEDNQIELDKAQETLDDKESDDNEQDSSE